MEDRWSLFRAAPYATHIPRNLIITHLKVIYEGRPGLQNFVRSCFPCLFRSRARRWYSWDCVCCSVGFHILYGLYIPNFAAQTVVAFVALQPFSEVCRSVHWTSRVNFTLYSEENCTLEGRNFNSQIFALTSRVNFTLY